MGKRGVNYAKSKATEHAHSSNPLQTSLCVHCPPLSPSAGSDLPDIAHAPVYTDTPQNPVSTPKREAQSRAREEEKTPKSR